LSSESYDVIIVGAGPAGSYAGYRLASLGHKVAVLEQKEAPGLDVCCTGVISAECFRSFGISPKVILRKADSARFFSPSGRCLRLQSEKVQAYVVDRASFDQAIAGKAQAQGAHFFFSLQVTDIAAGNGGAQVEALCRGSREKFASRAIILANGFRPKLPHKLGLGEIKHFLTGAQAQVETRDIDEVEVYFGQGTAPGLFAWLVPASPNRALAGLLSTSQAKLHLQRFLLGPFCQGRVLNGKAQIAQRAVPLGSLPRTYGDRILVIGDAAGQVKPTSGGGIYFGHLGARIAADVLHRALSTDDLGSAQLSCYQKEWKAKMGREISLGYWARRLYAKLNDRDIERIFGMLDSGGMAQALLDSPNFSFDWHSKSILAGLKHSLAYPARGIVASLPWRGREAPKDD
jgi:digeranylgeranylglycerophospholipid reductase